MEIEIRKVGRALLVSLRGELDLATAGTVREAVDSHLEKNARLRHLVWDLAGVGFIDSSGVAVLLGRYKKIEAREGQMFSVGASDAVQKVLQMAGIQRIMKFVDSEERALAEIGGDK